MRAAIIALFALGCAARTTPANPPQRESKPAELRATWREAADNWNSIGDVEYSRANFDKAIDAFKRAYRADGEADADISRTSRYLYKIAEAYRQQRDCNEAAFFYKRYLALMDDAIDAEQRREINARIIELNDCSRSR